MSKRDDLHEPVCRRIAAATKRNRIDLHEPVCRRIAAATAVPLSWLLADRAERDERIAKLSDVRQTPRMSYVPHQNGRPRRTDSPTRPYSLRLTQAETEALEQHARAREVPASVLVREAMDAAGLFRVPRKRARRASAEGEAAAEAT